MCLFNGFWFHQESQGLFRCVHKFALASHLNNTITFNKEKKKLVSASKINYIFFKPEEGHLIEKRTKKLYNSIFFYFQIISGIISLFIYYLRKSPSQSKDLTWTFFLFIGFGLFHPSLYRKIKWSIRLGWLGGFKINSVNAEWCNIQKLHQLKKNLENIIT
ncbi:hypothetical protein BpHYR1_017303 [Brachionus plicatilis]|uniref:Uncharacterized protein n=1 Tax=Brachionus plicatilis TaxID=10195 RepID=A0A3M7R4I4_BRAPC|nr:hypothetical protein BpHYR1_017303 [Brachionus plicatilis]